MEYQKGMVLRARKMLRIWRAKSRWGTGSVPLAQEDMLHYIGRVEEVIAGRNDHDGLGYVHKIRD